MCTTEHTDRLGQSDASGPNCQPDGRSIPELLAEVETLTRRSEWLLTDYLTTVAKGWQEDSPHIFEAHIEATFQ